MERVTIHCTTACLFTYSFFLNEQHMNMGGHMGNEMVFILANQVRTKFFQHIGVPEFDHEHQSGTIMANAAVKYINEGLIGDKITVQVYIDHISEITFDFKIRFIKNDAMDLAIVRQGILWFDYNHRKPIELPKLLIDFCKDK